MMIEKLLCSFPYFQAAQKLSLKINFFWKDREGFYLGSNDLMLSLVGIDSQKDLLGKRDIDFPLQEALTYIEEDRQVMHYKKEMNFYGQATLPNRRIKFYTTKIPVFDDKKNIIGVFGASRHIADYVLNPGEIDPSDLLTKREKDCLVQLVKGKTSKETADFLNISNRTVEQHIAAAKDKLQCYTKSSLMEKSIYYGLIYP